jgi:hypothetical protein
LTRRTDSAEFNDVTKIAVSEVSANVVRPLFEFGCIDLDGDAALATRKVVMVRFDHASAIETLTSVRHDDVHVVARGQFLQLRIDGGERYMATVSFDHGVKVLCADEALDLAQGANHLSALHGIS